MNKNEKYMMPLECPRMNSFLTNKLVVLGLILSALRLVTKKLVHELLMKFWRNLKIFTQWKQN